MKKRIALILTLMLLAVLTLASCMISQTPGNTDTGTNTNTDVGEKPDSGTEDEGGNKVDPSTCKHLNKVLDPEVEPTCYSTGLTRGTHCVDCGTVTLAQRERPKVPHSAVANTDVAPTCTEVGYEGGTHCSMCEIPMDEATELPPTGHNEVLSQDTLPTCEEDGSTGGTHCYVCGETLKEGTKIPAKGHTEVLTKGTEPTCSKEGLTDGTHCSECGKAIIEQRPIDKLPHTEVQNKDVAPGCETVGFTGGSHCSVCFSVVVPATKVPATGHKEVARTDDLAPTCTEDGYRGGTCCEYCNKTIVAGTVIPATGHNEVARTENTEPTCITVGYEGGTYCSVCNKTIKTGTVIPAKGHTETVLAGYAPTCTKKGLSDGKYCKDCNLTIVAQVELDTANHNEVITAAVAPTCKSVGYTEKRQCSVCNTVTLQSTMIEKTGHIAVVDKAVAPTCTETGLTEGSHCSACNTVLVAQQKVAANGGSHVYSDFATVTKQPTTSSTGTGTLTCTKCSTKTSVTFPKLVFAQLTKDDIYSVETDIYNVAYDNRWKVVDGNTTVSSIYSSGDWFGNKGDILTITLKQEMALSNLKVYTAGNWTYGTIRVIDSKGNVTASKTICAKEAAYGGTAQEHVIYNSSTAIKAYTIEVEIGDIKGVGTFKVSEVLMRAAPLDTRMEHTHDFREFIETERVATCQATQLDAYECFCGKISVVEGEKGDHDYSILKEELLVSCTEKGVSLYECACGKTKSVETEPTGHIFYKFLNYDLEPTTSTYGVATYKCIGCNQREQVRVSPLPIEEISYLRVDKIENGKVVLKLNIYGDRPSYEVRYSTKEITSENFLSAKILDTTVKGEGLVTITVTLDAGLDNCYYIAVLPYEGENYGEIATIRVGGDGEIPISYEKAQVYHGEVLNSFRSLFDDDLATKLGVIFPNSGDTAQLYGSNLAPIVDLEYQHYITRVSLYFDVAGKTVTVRWSENPLDFMSANSEWDGYENITTFVGWNDVMINEKARYFQIIFKDGESPCEVTAYGYQMGEGDEIATTVSGLPTIGELMGMCGFVAAGGGNTPIDSVSCVTVLREYHNFGWSYDATKYGGQASFFTGSWMGNFDYEYEAYKQAGLEVVPCIQWKLGSGETISYKVGSDNLPVYDSNGKLIAATFWERFDPNTYFVFADNVFAYAARYGSNNSAELLAIAKLHCSSAPVVGQGTIQWIEMGNEPDGSWNGIHNYLSAYQLAAATSAAYDGHCSSIPVASTAGYHLGGKNADSNIKLALAGVSGVSNEYITALCHWMKANRADGEVAFDAFNVHHYMTKQIELPNGSTAYVGISPEEANIKEVLSDLIELRDKYYPEKEIWVTEFGWDTNQSYATSTSSHAYAEYSGREVQAMWLTRAYLIFSSMGISKADMYMCEDTGVEEVSVGKYGTCGVIGFEYDENGNMVEVKKESYYYLYTLKNTLGGYTFDSEVEAYDENVLIYKYVTSEGKTAYAVWCPTSDGTKSENYQLRIDAETATLVEAVHGDIDGIRTNLTADEYGYVSIDVSENPIYILVD